MKKTIQKLMGSEKYVIAAVHLLPLPGSTGYDRSGGMKAIIDRAKRDTKILVDGGVHSLLFTNEADMPYVFHLPSESIAAFTAVVQEIMHVFHIPFGINALVDAYAGFCIAHATGASFIRGLFSGIYITDFGIIENQGPRIFLERSNLGAREPYFFHNLNSPVGVQPDHRTGAEEASSIISHINVDGFTLPATDLEMFSKINEIAPDMPLVAGTGTNTKNLESLLKVCDGTIVATCLREDGQLLNPVDPNRVAEFMDIFHKATK